MGIPRSHSIGQLLVVALDEPRWTTSRERLLTLCRPGGVLLSARLLDTPQSTAELLKKITLAVGSLPFLALEEEGGVVDPLRAVFPPLPAARTAARKGLAAVARLGDLIGAALKLLGLNTNLAPVLDLSSPLSERELGARTFDSHAAGVARCGNAFLRGLRRHGILACGKHFPGLASARAEGRNALAVSAKPMAPLWREDLLPYRRLFSRLPMVLLSRAAYKAYDFDLLCSAGLSAKVVEGLLRVRLGYRGLAISQKLESPAVRGALDLGEAVVKSVNAGCDLLLVRGEKNALAVFNALRTAIDSGSLSTSRVERTLIRVRAAKKAIGSPSGKVATRAFDQLARQFEDYKKFQGEEWKIA